MEYSESLTLEPIKSTAQTEHACTRGEFTPTHTYPELLARFEPYVTWSINTEPDVFDLYPVNGVFSRFSFNSCCARETRGKLCFLMEQLVAARGLYLLYIRMMIISFQLRGRFYISNHLPIRDRLKFARSKFLLKITDP